LRERLIQKWFYEFNNIKDIDNIEMELLLLTEKKIKELFYFLNAYKDY